MQSAMLDDPTPAADRESAQSRFAVHSRSEILALMRAIMQRKLLVNLDLPGSRHIVVTSVIAVEATANRVILDVARGDALNRELLSGKGAEFITQLDGVSISFATGPVSLIDYEKLPALSIAVPASVIRLQRREHFRVTLPIARPVKCIVLAQGNDDPEPIQTHIIDVSCGGVALADVAGRLGTVTGRVLERCRLLLPELDPVTTDLEIRNAAQIRRANGSFQTRLGCRFVNLPNDAAAMLQRFIMKIERDRRNTL